MTIKKVHSAVILVVLIVGSFISVVQYGDSQWLRKTEAAEAEIVDRFNEEAAQKALDIDLQNIRDRHRRDNCRQEVANIQPLIARYDDMVLVGGTLLPSQESDLEWLTDELLKYRRCGPD